MKSKATLVFLLLAATIVLGDNSEDNTLENGSCPHPDSHSDVCELRPAWLTYWNDANQLQSEPKGEDSISNFTSEPTGSVSTGAELDTDIGLRTDEDEPFYADEQLSVDLFHDIVPFDGARELTFTRWAQTNDTDRAGFLANGGQNSLTSFWIFPLQHSADWQPLMVKGDSLVERNPGIYIRPDDGILHCTVRTSTYQNEFMESTRPLPLGQWTHVMYLTEIFPSDSNAFRYRTALYLNGTLDTQGALDGIPLRNNGSFHVGKDDFHPGFRGFMSNLTVSVEAYKETVLQNLVSSFTPPVHPFFDLYAAMYPAASSAAAVEQEKLSAATDDLNPSVSTAESAAIDEDTMSTPTIEADIVQNAVATREPPLSSRSDDYFHGVSRWCRRQHFDQYADFDVDEIAAAAEHGVRSALAAYGSLHLFGERVTQNLTRAAELFRLAGNDSEAAFSLGVMHLGALGTPRDVTVAMNYMRIAVLLGSAEASMVLSRCSGPASAWHGCEPNIFLRAFHAVHAAQGAAGLPQKALELVLLTPNRNDYEFGHRGDDDHVIEYETDRAERHNDVGAMTRLGTVNYFGTHGMPVNHERAFEWFNRAAEGGHAPAMSALAGLYAKGEGVAKNNQSSYDWFVKAAALNETEALNGLGYLYYRGDGVEQNYTAALEYWERASALGSGDARYNAALMHLTGTGVPLNYTKAVELLQPGAYAGHRSCIYQMGYCHMFGWGARLSVSSIIFYFDWMATNAEWASSLQRAQQRVLAYENEAALVGYLFGAAMGYQQALYNAAFLIDTGTVIDGMEKPFSLALSLFEQAEVLDHNWIVDAVVRRAHLLFDGKGSDIDQAEALALYISAMHRGSAEGAFYAGYCYHYGFGTEADEQTARQLYAQAAVLSQEQQKAEPGWVVFLVLLWMDLVSWWAVHSPAWDTVALVVLCCLLVVTLLVRLRVR